MIHFCNFFNNCAVGPSFGNVGNILNTCAVGSSWNLPTWSFNWRLFEKQLAVLTFSWTTLIWLVIEFLVQNLRSQMRQAYCFFPSWTISTWTLSWSGTIPQSQWKRGEIYLFLQKQRVSKMWCKHLLEVSLKFSISQPERVEKK